MIWKVPCKLNTSKLCIASMPATSMMPVHHPSDSMWWLSAMQRVVLDGLNGARQCFCVCHFFVQMVFLMAPPSITACIRIFSPFGPRKCIHLRYTWVCLLVSPYSCPSTARSRLVMGSGYAATLSCCVHRTVSEKNVHVLSCPFLLLC